MKEELTHFNEQLQLNAKRVANQLARVQAVDGKSHAPKYSYTSGDDIRFAQEFWVEDGWCYWNGSEAHGYGAYTDHEGKFEIKYLCMSDEELETWVNKEIARLKEKQKKDKERKALEKKQKTEEAKKLKEAKERQLLLELQKKYPDLTETAS
jgi:hypothetical protein